MKFITLVAALAAAVPAVFGLTINTPASVVECEPTQLAWSGGSGPYYLSLVPAGQPSAPAIQQFPSQTGTSYTWTVNLQSGVSFTIALKDSTGAVAYSDIITVTAGTSTDCINSSAQQTNSGGSGAASTGGSGSTAAGATTAAGTTGAATSASSKSTATTTASGSTSTSSSAAGRLSVSSAFGVAGVMGLVGAALF